MIMVTQCGASTAHLPQVSSLDKERPLLTSTTTICFLNLHRDILLPWLKRLKLERYCWSPDVILAQGFSDQCVLSPGSKISPATCSESEKKAQSYLSRARRYESSWPAVRRVAARKSSRSRMPCAVRLLCSALPCPALPCSALLCSAPLRSAHVH